MIVDKEKRLDAFEKMLESVRQQYEAADTKMKQLQAEGKEKTATYRQLMVNSI